MIQTRIANNWRQLKETVDCRKDQKMDGHFIGRFSQYSFYGFHTQKFIARNLSYIKKNNTILVRFIARWIT